MARRSIRPGSRERSVMVRLQSGIVSQQFPQLPPCVAQMAPGHPFRQLELCGDLCVAPSFEVVKQHNIALSFAEIRERSHQRLAELVAQRLVVGSHRRLNLLMQRNRLGRANAQIVAAIVGGVPDDPEQPCAELVRLATVVEALEATDECILAYILRIESIAYAGKS